MGKAVVNDAQVLITTQQMVERRLNGGNFKNASKFHFRGHPRAVRIWDESYLPRRSSHHRALRLGIPLRAARQAHIQA